MSNLFLTLIIAFVIIVLAIACMAIGWLITGKTKIQAGGCGKNPTKSKNDSCNTVQSCDLCHPETKQKNSNETDSEKDT